MALPGLDKTWIIDANNQVAASGFQENGNDDATLDMKNVLVQVKDAMVASGEWSVKLSCGGNGAGTFTAGKVAGAGDNWTTGSDIMWVDLDSIDRAWIILVNSALDLEVCLDLVTRNLQDGGEMAVLVSRPILNTGGFTGGSLNARPTAPDEIFIQKTGEAGVCWGLGTNRGGAATDWAWDTFVSDDGECTIVVFFTAGSAPGMWYFGKMKNPTDANDVLVKTGCQTSIVSEDISISNYYDGLNYWRVSHRNPDTGLHQSDVNNDAPKIFITCESRAGVPLPEAFTIANDVDGDFPLFPAGMAADLPSYVGRHGELFDIHWGLTVQPQATTYPAAGGKTFVQFGHFVFPWNGTNPVVG